MPRTRPTAIRADFSLLLFLASVGLLLTGLAGLLPPAVAEDEPVSAEEEERLEALLLNTEKGWAAFRTGNHEEVLARMKRVAKYDPASPLPTYLTARVHERTGQYEEALRVASEGLETHPGHRGLEGVRFKVLHDTGRLDALTTAARAASAANGANLIARSWLARGLEVQGRRAEALAEYDAIIAHYNGNDVTVEEAPVVAHAAVRATWLSPNAADDMIPTALKLLDRHLRAHEDDLDAKLQLAEVYQADRGSKSQSLANKFYDQILKANTEVAEARVGRSRSALMFYKQGDALQDLARALETNPNLVGALELKAAIHVGNGDYEQAEKHLAHALSVNASAQGARSVQAALHWIRGEKAKYEALRDAVLAQDAAYGDFYVMCADLVGERQRRYDVAMDFARKAIEIEPGNRYAYVTLGEALMNRGRTDEALEQFQVGVEKSKKYRDVRRDNWIEVLAKWMPGFKVLETEHFRIRVPLAEWPVMQHYLPDLLEESYDTLTAKYGFVVESPTYADAFNRDDDFSVRSVGTPGLPALGVCFGNTITLLGPTAKPMGQFSWSRTAWHEFAHVVTLQQSKGQVPRWLTEGLSVFEEKQRRDRWGRDMERELYARWRNGRLLKMADINQAFRGPDIMFAYFQGGLIADHLLADRGFAVIPEMLRAFAEDRTTEQVFKDVLGLDLATYDKQFATYVESVVGQYRMMPAWDEKSMAAFGTRTSTDPSDAEAWIRMAWGHVQRGRQIDAGDALGKALALDAELPEAVLLQGRMAEMNRRVDLAIERYEKFLALGQDDEHVRLFLAGRALQAGTDSAKAIEHLQAAKACFPRNVGRDSPYLQLAKLYRGENALDKAMAELEGYAAIAAESFEVRKELLTWHRSKKDWAAVARVCEEMVDISPYGANIAQREAPDMEFHRHYAEALTELGQADAALRERQVQVAVGRLLGEKEQIEEGAVNDRVLLGNLFLERGDTELALAEALAALRLAPRDASALMLKRRAQEASGQR
ncbi:MAG: tetratricopeptide repeat protein [Planctomycetota bacterium]|nr:tetratricopeptide repeat protein [Planctomycetota bacterium]